MTSEKDLEMFARMQEDHDVVDKHTFERILGQERKLIFDQIVDERNTQLWRWGRDNHTPEEWCLIIGKHIGKLNESVLKLYEGCKLGMAHSEQQLEYQRKKIIQCAALLVAWEEQIRTAHLRIKENGSQE